MQMKLAHADLHQQPDFRIFTSSYAPGSVFGAHTDERPRISVVLRGCLREESGGEAVDATPAALVIKPADAVHRNTFGNAPVHLLTIEFTSQESGFTEGCFSSWRWLHGVASARVITAWMQGLAAASTPAEYKEAVIDLLARLPARAGAKAEPPAWLLRIRERIQDEHAEHLHTSDLAAEARVHPVYLARRYRQSYGCSISEDLTRLRLESSIPALADGRTDLVHVALDNGYTDQSHFQRRFRSAVGTTPGRFRKLCDGFC